MPLLKMPCLPPVYLRIDEWFDRLVGYYCQNTVCCLLNRFHRSAQISQ